MRDVPLNTVYNSDLKTKVTKNFQSFTLYLTIQETKVK